MCNVQANIDVLIDVLEVHDFFPYYNPNVARKHYTWEEKEVRNEDKGTEFVYFKIDAKMPNYALLGCPL